MNIQAINKFRTKLAEDHALMGVWITLESPSLSEAAVSLGVDWIVVDVEHGHLDWKDIVGHLRSTVRSDTVAFIRISEGSESLIKRSLDCGADGIIVPRIETADQLRRVVQLASYPPQGIRGIGAERATGWGQCLCEHVSESKSHTMVIPLVETQAGMKNLRDICSVDGVDIIHFGPADHSASAGFPGEWEGPGIAREIIEGLKEVSDRGKFAGVMARSPADLSLRTAQGFKVLGLGMDMGLYLSALKSLLKAGGKDARVQTSLQPLDIKGLLAESHRKPLNELPRYFRPDRIAAISQPGSCPSIELGDGVTFECMVGSRNHARNLTTGIVTFAPGSILPFHTHEFGESITVLDGELSVQVEGRHYSLNDLDNITIPAGVAHQAENLSGSEVKAHVALASVVLERKLVSIKTVEESKDRNIVREHVVKFSEAKRYAAGPHTEFVDHLNDDLIPGISMSGGYALFHPQGRLPAHLHDFDESICIIDGTAICNVEGEVFEMSNRSTALQPRGRIHYFINESSKPMAMLWVYAGPKPDRILIDEEHTRSGAIPWSADETEK
jgi:2-keto-3-deoxy-L-rhamnonate aldolase RhmA/quercetin dioxygenase-like cupin family protein